MAKEKSDWSKFESMRDPAGENSGRSQEVVEPNTLIQPAKGVGAGLPIQCEDPQSLLAKYQKGRLSRKASLEAMQATYDSRIEVLNHQLMKAVVVEKAKADVLAEKYLKELDSQHLVILSEMGLRNKETREDALMRLTQSTVNRIRELQQMDWPESMIKETFDQILELKKRAVGEIMSELGVSQSDE